MQVFKRSRKPENHMGAGSENAGEVIDTLIPPQRRPIIGDVVQGMGITMEAGAILEATRAVSGAIIVQRETAEDAGDREATINLAQSLIDENLAVLGRNREALSECDGDPAMAAELSLEQIRGLVNAAYEPTAA